MKKIHIGHHFFGSGNFGDDLMLAGFLEQAKCYNIQYTCCVPYPLEALEVRFPQINWLPYSYEARASAIKDCDVWLGLGGSAFQNSVSQWFTDHLDEETTLCRKFKKPIYFLGIGGQDHTAFSDERLKSIIRLSESVWVRDKNLYNQLISNDLLDYDKVHNAAVLAHIFFKIHVKRQIKQDSIGTILNFDYKTWPSLSDTLNSIKALNLREHYWLIQEKRPLPGSEKQLYQTLTSDQQAIWKHTEWDNSESHVLNAFNRWPSPEFILTSRFHATLASAWSGTRIVVLAINLKLQSAAEDFGIESLRLDTHPHDIIQALREAQPIPLDILGAKAALAENSVNDFFSSIGL